MDALHGNGVGPLLVLALLSMGCEGESSTGDTDAVDASGGPTSGSGSGSSSTTASESSSSPTTSGVPGSSSGDGDDTGSGSTTSGGQTVEIDFDALQSWTRVEGRVLEDVVDGYGVAADIHVFRDESGELAAVYSGTDPRSPDYAAIKLARATEHGSWDVATTLLSEVGSPLAQRNKETSFYRRAADGTHQIYYIGYEDEQTYASQIFRAQSDALEGPYTMEDAPVIARGMQGEHDIQVMTSPSIVAHDGGLVMVYCAWNQFEIDENLQVWVHGATSDDDGQTWTVLGEVDVPVCMEGALTRGPDGMYYAVSQQNEQFMLARAAEPLGPYTSLPEPILSPLGPPDEIEMNTPQLFFDDDVAFLYYSGANFDDADYEFGWWTLLAYTALE